MRELRWDLILGAALIASGIAFAGHQLRPTYSLVRSAPGHAFRLNHRTGEVLSCSPAQGCTVVYGGGSGDFFNEIERETNSQ